MEENLKELLTDNGVDSFSAVCIIYGMTNIDTPVGKTVLGLGVILAVLPDRKERDFLKAIAKKLKRK